MGGQLNYMNNLNLSAATIAKYCHCKTESVESAPLPAVTLEPLLIDRVKLLKTGPNKLKHPKLKGLIGNDYHRLYMRMWRKWTTNRLRRPVEFYEFKDGMSIVSIAKKHNLAMLEVETIIRKFMR